MNLDAALAELHAADAALADADPSPFHLPLGPLAPLLAGAVLGLSAQDWLVPGLRERVGAVLRGVPISRLVDGFAGAKPYRVAPCDASVANRALIGVGLALGAQEACALVHLGVGGLADGACAEAFNLAALTGAPVIFLVALHPLDGPAPLGPQLAGDPAQRGRAAGLAVIEVDALDAGAVRDAVTTARAARSPHLILAKLPSAA